MVFNGCGAQRTKIIGTRDSMSGVSGPTAGVSGQGVKDKPVVVKICCYR